MLTRADRWPYERATADTAHPLPSSLSTLLPSIRLVPSYHRIAAILLFLRSRLSNDCSLSPEPVRLGANPYEPPVIGAEPILA